MDSIISAISAIAAIASAIFAFITYRETRGLKRYDFRLQLRMAQEELRASVAALPALMERAKRSHDAVLAAIGQFRSGAKVKWDQRYDQDLEALARLEGECPREGLDFAGMSLPDLERDIAAAHALQLQANDLTQHYEASLAEDDVKRDHLREDQRANFNTRLAAELNGRGKDKLGS